jgi:hypothetical protein
MLTRLGASMGLAFAARKIVRDAAEGQKALAQLRAGLKSTAGGSGQTEESLVALSNEMQRTTTYADNLVQSASAVMLSFTKISGEVFPRAMKAAGDVAARMGTDLQGAVVQLSKALNDPITNLSAMSRAGIQFTKDQKVMIKSLWEAGEVAKAQTIILEELETQYGGSAEAARETLGGALTDLQNSLSDVTEEIGTQLTPAITEGGKVVSGIFQGWVAILKDSKRLLGEIGGSVAGYEAEILAEFGGRITEKELQEFAEKANRTIGEAERMLATKLGPMKGLKELAIPEKELAAMERADVARIEARERARLHMQEILAKEVEDVRVSTMSRVELAERMVTKRLAAITKAREEELQIGIDFDALEKEVKQQHADELDKIVKASQDKQRKFREMDNMQKLSGAVDLAQGLVRVLDDGSRTAFEINKGVAAADTIVNTASAAMKAYAQFGAFGAAAAGTVIAIGAAQLATILSTTYKGGGNAPSLTGGGGATGGPPGGGGTSASTGGGGGGAREFNVTIIGDQISTGQLRDLMERISDEGDDGTRMRVLE